MKAIKPARSVLPLLLIASWGGIAAADPITLAENRHLPTEGSGNNHYSDGDAIGNDGIGAENFTLARTFGIITISHVGHHARTLVQPTSIDWWIYSGDAGQPESILFSGNSTTFRSNVEGVVGPYDLTRYTIDLANVVLGPSTYWVGFHNNSRAGADPHWTFASSGTSFDGRSALSENRGRSWSNPTIRLSDQ
jgi:hypothetical protein